MFIYIDPTTSRNSLWLYGDCLVPNSYYSGLVGPLDRGKAWVEKNGTAWDNIKRLSISLTRSSVNALCIMMTPWNGNDFRIRYPLRGIHWSVEDSTHKGSAMTSIMCNRACKTVVKRLRWRSFAKPRLSCEVTVISSLLGTLDMCLLLCEK